MISGGELPLCAGTPLSAEWGAWAQILLSLGGASALWVSVSLSEMVLRYDSTWRGVDLRIWRGGPAQSFSSGVACAGLWKGRKKAKKLLSLASGLCRVLPTWVHSPRTPHSFLPFSAQQGLSLLRASVSLWEPWAQYPIFYPTPESPGNSRPPWGLPSSGPASAI